MRRVRLAWNEFFYASGDPRNLAACRVLFFGLTFLLYRGYQPGRFGEFDSALWAPLDVFTWLQLGPASPDTLEWLAFAWRGSLLLSCVGLLTRISTTTAFLLGFYLIGLPYNFGKVDHNDAVIPFALCCFALSHCGDAWSLDAWIGRLRGRRALAAGGEYTWPIRAMWVLMTLVFFGSAVSKLEKSGAAWVLSDNMQTNLLRHQVNGCNPPSDFGLYLARYDQLCVALAGTALLLELVAPLALFSRRCRLVIVPGLFAMQVGIWAMLGVQFAPMMACYLFWIPWHSWFAAGACAIGAATVRLQMRRPSTILPAATSRQ